jgi:hypothetical protein
VRDIETIDATDVLVAVARAAFDVEMDDRRVRLVDYARHRRTRR